MLRAGAGFSTHSDPREAAREACEAVLAAVPAPDSAFLFAAPGYGDGVRPLVDAVADHLGTRAVVGALAHGVLAAGRDREEGPAISLLAQSGIACQPFLLPDLAGEESSAGAEIAARLGGPPRSEDLIVVLPDPRGIHAEPLLAGLRASLEPACVVGAGAAQSVSEPSLQWCGSEVAEGALAGMVLRGAKPPRVGVTQACRPATELMTVTRVQGHWILELDGRPALDVYREVARGRLAEDLQRAAAFVLVALPRDRDEPLRPGGYLVRNVAGFAVEERAIALPEPTQCGQMLALALREPEAAREDIKSMLAGLGGDRPAQGLYFNCCARGESLFGVPGLEAGYLESAFGDAPIAGMYGSCEFGPIGGSAELLTYTGVLALLDA